MRRLLPALGLIRRTLSKRDGTAATEFALVATPLIFFLFAIVEIGVVFITNINLANSTLQLARQIRTGGIIAPGSSATSSSGISLSLSDFKKAICNNLTMVPAATCSSQLQVDIRTQSNFGLSSPSPIAGNVFDNANLCYYSGSGGSIVEFKAYYLWPVVTPVLLNALVTTTTYKSSGTLTAGNYLVLQSAEAFRIEPNSSGSNTGNGC